MSLEETLASVWRQWPHVPQMRGSGGMDEQSIRTRRTDLLTQWQRAMQPNLGIEVGWITPRALPNAGAGRYIEGRSHGCRRWTNQFLGCLRTMCARMRRSQVTWRLAGRCRA